VVNDEEFVKCCTQLQVLYELNPDFIAARMNRVYKPEEIHLNFGLQRLIQSVASSDYSFLEWCTFNSNDKKFLLECQTIISDESTSLEK